MTSPLPNAMILAAGFGVRMLPLTKKQPKAMVDVAGRPLIRRVLDRLAEAGFTRAIVNVHYQKQVLMDYLAGETDFSFTISEEPVLLETGGGITAALPHLGNAPFLAVNCDSLWLNGAEPALARLSRQWDEAAMDALLLLYPTVRLPDYQGCGDFAIDGAGRLRRPTEREIVPQLYTGVQILHPRLFAGAPAGPFSLNVLYDRAIENGRLFGLVHDGVWFHVSTPEDVAKTEFELAHL